MPHNFFLFALTTTVGCAVHAKVLYEIASARLDGCEPLHGLEQGVTVLVATVCSKEGKYSFIYSISKMGAPAVSRRTMTLKLSTLLADKELM